MSEPSGLTLSQIAALLHTAAGRYREADTRVLMALHECGLIEQFDSGSPDWRTTSRGTVLVGAIRALPLPVQVWVMPAQTGEE